MSEITGVYPEGVLQKKKNTSFHKINQLIFLHGKKLKK